MTAQGGSEHQPTFMQPDNTPGTEIAASDHQYITIRALRWRTDYLKDGPSCWTLNINIQESHFQFPPSSFVKLFFCKGLVIFFLLRMTSKLFSCCSQEKGRKSRNSSWQEHQSQALTSCRLCSSSWTFFTRSTSLPPLNDYWTRPNSDANLQLLHRGRTD